MFPLQDARGNRTEYPKLNINSENPQEKCTKGLKCGCLFFGLPVGIMKHEQICYSRLMFIQLAHQLASGYPLRYRLLCPRSENALGLSPSGELNKQLPSA